jgi:hypothetical protein
MANSNIIDLLTTLLQATQEGRLHWTATDQEESFKIDLGAAFLEIERTLHGSDGDYLTYDVAIKNDKGKTLEVEFFNQFLNKEHFAMVESLYDLARKDALKIDKLIDSMIDKVKETR